jgi:lipooligosaccharide transport system ATP-binding protein
METRMNVPQERDIVVAARGLTKTYNRATAVNGIDFDVYSGVCFGFLGPNGAGKTTTLRMIYGFSPITAGQLRVLGMDPGRDMRRIKARLGVVPQENNLDEDMSVLQNLVVYARYFDMPGDLARERAKQELEFWQLWDRRDSAIRELSGGMKRRLLIGRAMLNRPALIVLDEPTTGLDPQARHLVWQKLRQLRNEGVTMVLTTHYMDEAAQLCDRLVILNDGVVLAEGGPADLVKHYLPAQVLEVHSVDSGLEKVKAEAIAAGATVDAGVDSLYIYTPDADALRKTLDLSCCSDFAFRLSSLEDVFLHLTGRALLE